MSASFHVIKTAASSTVDDAMVMNNIMSHRDSSSSVIFSLPVSIFDRGNGSTVETTFVLYSGDRVEDRMEEFGLRHSLAGQHVKELREVVRDGLLVQGSACAVPLPTLIVFEHPDHGSYLFATAAGGGGLEHHQGSHPSLRIVVLSKNNDEDVSTTRGHMAMPDLLALMQHDRGLASSSSSSMIYAVVSPLTRFQKGRKPADLFLEYERFRYAATGSFQAPLVLGMSCGNAGHLDVILWDKSASDELVSGLGNGYLFLQKNEDFLRALLRKDGRLGQSGEGNTFVYTAPATFTHEWLACDGMGRLAKGNGDAGLDVLIVIIAQGEDDKVTSGVFWDVAHILLEVSRHE